MFVLPFVNLLVFLPFLFGYTVPEVPQQFPFDIINFECVLTPWLGAGIAWGGREMLKRGRPEIKSVHPIRTLGTTGLVAPMA